MSDCLGTVRKRNNSIVDFEQSKISAAIEKAMKAVNQYDKKNLERSTEIATDNSVGNSLVPVSVDFIHKQVENALMELRLFDVAREYITYRDQHKPDIFRPRHEIEPVEYPQFHSFIDAVHHSFWTHEEFSYTSDIQDMKVNLSDTDQSIVLRAMLAISQVENAVKTFWGRIDMTFPKPEISDLAATFADNEVRHGHSYKNLIKLLGLNDEFSKLKTVPAIQKRIDYLNETNKKRHTDDPKDFFEAVVLFSMFVENMSLFSQFLILMSYNKHGNMLKGMSNVIEATSLEEVIHANAGFTIVDIIKEENPKWWTPEIKGRVIDMVEKVYNAEMEIVDWIYEKGDSNFAPKEITQELIKERLNDSLEKIGIDEYRFDIDSKKIERADWFIDEILLTRDNDFFNKRSNTYNKSSKPVTSNDLF